MEGFAVGFGEDRDRLDFQLAGRADDPEGDLPAVGDQDFPEHAR